MDLLLCLHAHCSWHKKRIYLVYLIVSMTPVFLLKPLWPHKYPLSRQLKCNSRTSSCLLAGVKYLKFYVLIKSPGLSVLSLTYSNSNFQCVQSGLITGPRSKTRVIFLLCPTTVWVPPDLTQAILSDLRRKKQHVVFTVSHQMPVMITLIRGYGSARSL